MAKRDWWWRFLARVLPWFDQADWDAERQLTRKAIAESRAVRAAYRSAATRLSR